MRHKRTRRRVTEINVVPYIDVMLVLLVIFMITTPLLSQGVKIDLPHAKAHTLSKAAQEPLIVSVDRQGLYYLNIADRPTQAVAPQTLAIRIAAELRLAQEAGQARLVLVKGDRDVKYGQVVAAMVLLQQAGVKKVGLMTQPPPGTHMG